MSGFWSEGDASADRRVRVTAFRVLALEAAAEIAAPERERGTPTCTGPGAAQPECGWKRGERRHGRTPEAQIARRRPVESAAVREVEKPGTVLCRAKSARQGARGAAPEPRQGGYPPGPPGPFPFFSMFQNGPRRQGFAPPRKKRAPLTAPGRSEESTEIRERGPSEWRCSRDP